MIILALQGIRKSFGTHEVLRNASLTLQDGEKMGLVGVNGSGKSTLMKIIAGLENPDEGSVSIQKGLRIGYLAQQGELSGEETVLRALESVFDPIIALEKEMRETEARMAETAGDEELPCAFYVIVQFEPEERDQYVLQEEGEQYQDGNEGCKDDDPAGLFTHRHRAAPDDLLLNNRLPFLKKRSRPVCR